MTFLNRNQRTALKALFDRTTIWAKDLVQTTCDSAYGVGDPMSYREFRKRAHRAFGMGDAIIVPWAGIWIVIEPDGYTHS